MKRLTLTIVAVLFAASAGAESAYHGLAEGNPDLRGEGPMPAGESGPDPAADVHGEFAEDNPDLSSEIETTKPPKQDEAEIYQGLEPNPDLTAGSQPDR